MKSKAVLLGHPVHPMLMCVSHHRTVLTTRWDGFVNAEPDHGGFIRNLRMGTAVVDLRFHRTRVASATTTC